MQQVNPGTGDTNCTPKTVIGNLERFVPINFASSSVNMVDAAFVVSSAGVIENLIGCGICAPNSALAPGTLTLGTVVQKCGRTTGLTQGKVVTINLNGLSVGSDCGTATFDSQYEVQAIAPYPQFSLPGDSGSPVVTVLGNNSVGMLFAGDTVTGDAFVNDINNVLPALQVTLGGGAGPCVSSGAPSDHSGFVISDGATIYQVVPGEIFVAEAGGTLLKISGSGGSGQNMFALLGSGGSTHSVGQCYHYLVGVQQFPSDVTSVNFIAGSTLIGLADGRVLRVSGTGGSGYNMFAVTTSGDGFSGLPGYPYYIGSHQFDHGIVSVTAVGGETFLSFADGKMLKAQGAGGGGKNLFAIKETSGGFSGIAGYSYYLGDQKFAAAVSSVLSVPGETMIGLSDGKMLKVKGTGGTGHNMFAVNESSGGFSGIAGYPYYLGDQKFNEAVLQLTFGMGVTLVGLGDGKLLKVAGTGGSGHNMFAVTESSGSISGISPYPYYVGDQKFSSPVTAIVFAAGQTLMGLESGRLLKVTGTGGSGHDMFAVTETSNGFATVPGYGYLLGSTYFGSPVVDVTEVDMYTFVTLGNGKVLKVQGTGGTGYNLFAVAQQAGGFAGLCGFPYFVGTQAF